MKKTLLIAFSFCALTCSAQKASYADYVNPLMGSLSSFELSTGNTYPATAMPWGMNFWTPQTGKMGDGWQYTYNAHKIRGIKQTHQPSPWINDYGEFAIMPMSGKPIAEEEERASWFSHKGEISRPYYYKVYLAEHDVIAEVVPTERAAIFQFTFPEADSYVNVDAYDRNSHIQIIPSENKIVGYTTRNSGGVPENFKNYFVVVFDKPFTYTATYSNDVQPEKKDGTVPVTIKEGQLEQTNFHTGAIIGFKTKKGELVHAKVASSFISPEQAEINLKELGSDSFETLKAKGKAIWDNMLGRIEVEGGDLDQVRTFYSCLYRSLLFPRKFYEKDATGKIVHYSPYNGKIEDGYMFTDAGFWDVFRCLFPLLNMMYPSLNKEIQEGLINTYKESGFFPEWASPGHRGCMVGNNSASILVDAYLKGIKVDDVKTLYEGLIHGCNDVMESVSSTGRLGYQYYNTLGYVPYDVKISENAARTLEYCYDDWCILQLAKLLNNSPEFAKDKKFKKQLKADIATLEKRSFNYKNLFDPESKLMRGKKENGEFMAPFSPLKWGDAFTEGNSWHYTWSVFHDPQGLINLMGGKEDFVSMLDSVFSVPPIYDDSYYGFPIHEITEMTVMNMGNYAHGNQPIQHMIYLYDWAGQPWKAQYWLRETMNRMYTPQADGYCGDEDNGQTSAWYVFTALGFYPVCPGTNEYALGAPLFKKATLHMENGKTVVINAPENSDKNRYVGKMTLNGKDYTKNYITYEDLLKGSTIHFQMTDKPNTQRGTQDTDFPYSYTNEVNASKKK
ncbi:MAG: GH92 family glycosyl hydrolase [Bacteroidaceae bacterium]|nr:GH92 family glycosyl hydrolase [Bacteroidaceae bacterium]